MLRCVSGATLRIASLSLAFILTGSIECRAAETADSVNLREVEVVATSQRISRLDDSGALTVDASLIGKNLRSLGEADAVGYLKLLPGVTSGNDYGSGLSIQGGDYSHTLFRINGAPLFFPYHFGGIFSVVSPAHYPIVKLEKAIHELPVPSRLGGLVDMSTRRGKLDRVAGSVNVGVISSGLGMSIPVSGTLDVIASARISYIDELYGKLLRGNSSATYYDLGDVSVTAVWTPGLHDRITSDFFMNSDNLRILDDAYAMNTLMKWKNIVASVGWEHRMGKGVIKTSAYYSGFSNRLSLAMPQLGLRLPSGISQVSVNGTIDLPIDSLWRVKAGYDLMLNTVLPQWADLSGYSSPHVEPEKEHGYEAALSAGVYRRVSQPLMLSVAVRVAGYAQGRYRKLLVDPSVTASLSESWGNIKFQVASYSQALHQVGFSDIGLASNFWLGSTAELPVQRALSAAVNYNKSFFDGRYTCSADIYFKRLWNSSEYDGYILGLLDGDYTARDNILTGDGYNYGVDLMLSRNFGRFTGSAGYAFGIARRRFDPTAGWITASSELRHSVNMFARYRIDSRWSLSAAFTYASGRPVTPIKAFYMVGENVFMDYGRRNSGNLPAYHRLDLSATYSFSTRKILPLRHFVNVSVLNAYGHRNVDIVSYNYDSDDNMFYRKEVASLYRFMPSVSYTIEF